MKLVLASRSPRRIELMQLLGIPFCAKVSDCDESCEGTAIERVQTLALRKGKAVAREMDESCWVLGADTLVEKDGVILGKPRDERDAFEMLRMLSGGWHSVHTGVALCHARSGGQRIEAETARVRFAPMDDEAIRRYIATGEPMDKAGAYGIQGRAGAYIDRVEGDWYAVVGLPLCRVRRMLEEAGVYNAAGKDKLLDKDQQSGR